jgi:hypothetical protein
VFSETRYALHLDLRIGVQHDPVPRVRASRLCERGSGGRDATGAEVTGHMFYASTASPVASKTTRRPISTAWSAKRS